MELSWFVAVMLAAALVPGPAQAQDAARKLMFSGRDLAVFVPETMTGLPNHRTVELMMVFNDLVDGGDVHLNPWVVDCTTMSAQALDGRAFLGTQFLHQTDLETPMKPTEPGSFERAIADYACTGVRYSTDATMVRTFGEAIDYGHGLVRQTPQAADGRK